MAFSTSVDAPAASSSWMHSAELAYAAQCSGEEPAQSSTAASSAVIAASPLSSIESSISLTPPGKPRACLQQVSHLEVHVEHPHDSKQRLVWSLRRSGMRHKRVTTVGISNA